MMRLLKVREKKFIQTILSPAKSIKKSFSPREKVHRFSFLFDKLYCVLVSTQPPLWIFFFSFYM